MQRVESSLPVEVIKPAPAWYILLIVLLVLVIILVGLEITLWVLFFQDKKKREELDYLRVMGISEERLYETRLKGRALGNRYSAWPSRTKRPQSPYAFTI